MDFLQTEYLGNSMQTWLIAVVVTLLVMVAVRMALRLGRSRLKKFAAGTDHKIDDLAVMLVEKTKFFFPFVVGVYAGSRPLILSSGMDRALEVVTVLALLVQGGIWANAVFTWWITQRVKRQMEEDAAAATSIGALRFVGSLILWAVVLLLALDNLGIDITALVTGLGIGGIAVALAIQNVLGDLFASLSIVLDKPFVMGDFIIVGDFMGTVERVGLKTTRLRSLSGEQLVFANSDLLNSRIRNYKRMFERRIVFGFGVIYGTPAEQVEAIPGMVREIIEKQEDTRFDRAHFKAYGASSLDYEVVYYVKKPDYNVYMDIQQAINLALYRRFEELGIEFAFPTRTIHIESAPKEAAMVAADGSR